MTLLWFTVAYDKTFTNLVTTDMSAPRIHDIVTNLKCDLES